MRIFIYAANFFPNVGGMETIIDAMAREFVTMGHEVRLATDVPPDKDPDYDGRFPYPVYRRPGPGQLLSLVKWGQIYYQSGPYIKKAWPLLLFRRPWVIEYMLWSFGDPGTPMDWKTRLRVWLLSRTAWHMGQSHALVRYLPVPSSYVPTPFRSGVLRVIPEVARDRDVVFAGRLIKIKGVQTMIEALGILRSRGRRYTATIVGRGADEAEFRALATKLGLDDTVEFAGVKFGEDFARTLNRHEVMAVPSIWDEPFGTVAAEGIACGCVVVATESGGLPDTVGPCGVLVPRDNPPALADALEKLLENRGELGKYRACAAEHLAQYRQDVCAEARLKVFQDALNRR